MCLLLAGTKGGRTCFDVHLIGQPKELGRRRRFGRQAGVRAGQVAGGLVIQTPVQCCPRFKKKECYQGLHWKFSNRIAIAYKYPPNLRLSSSIFPSFHLSTHFYFCIRLLNLDCIVLLHHTFVHPSVYTYAHHSHLPFIMGKVKESKGSKAPKVAAKAAPKVKEVVSKKATPSKKSKKEESSDSESESGSDDDSDAASSSAADSDSDSEADKKPTKAAPKAAATKVAAKTNGKTNGAKKAAETSDSSDSSDDDDEDDSESDSEEAAKPAAAAAKEATVSTLVKCARPPSSLQS